MTLLSAKSCQPHALELASGRFEPYNITCLGVPDGLRCRRVGHVQPSRQVSFGHMPGYQLLFAKVPRKLAIFRTWLADQQAAEAPWRSFGFTIPEAGWGSGECGRQQAQHGAGQEHQCGQALDTFRGVHTLTVGADHLRGAHRDVRHRPAVRVHCPHTFRLECDWRRQQPGLFESRVGDGVHVKNPVLRVRRHLVHNQVAPTLGAQLASVLLPALYVASGGVAASVLPLYWRANGRTNVPSFALRPR